MSDLAKLTQLMSQSQDGGSIRVGISDSFDFRCCIPGAWHRAVPQGALLESMSDSAAAPVAPHLAASRNPLMREFSFE